MNKLIEILKEEKSIPVDKFFNLALYDKKFGYYMKKNPFGKSGDYVTSPLISNLFGEMVAIWCLSFWEHLGKPKKILLVELGPGDGSLSFNLLNTFKKFNHFYQCLDIKLLEKSNKLKKIQKNKIKNKKVKWIKKINELKKGPIIFLSNEFFDSLAIKQILKKKESFFERYVTLGKEGKIKFLYKKANKNLIKSLKQLNLTYKNNIIEYPADAIKYLNIIAKKINKYDGGLLTFDYGSNQARRKDTLQSVRKHKYFNIFSDPSNADITSHINYKLFSKILKNKKLNVKKIVTQNEFLQKLGIIERANIISQEVSFKEKINIYYRLKRILDYKGMGGLFKVLFAQKKGTKFSLGFL